MHYTKTWQQGAFIDHPKYKHMPESWKADRDSEEKLSVCAGPNGNAICKTTRPEDAVWIANRLNLASKLEELSYDFATGKNNGEALAKFVHETLAD